MPVKGVMFRPKYRGGAKYARLFRCMGCNKQTSETPAKDKLIYEIPGEDETEKGFIMFYRCECGTVNWTHALRSSIDIYDDVTRATTIPDWAEGDPKKGIIDYTPRIIDSRTGLPPGMTEKSMEGLRAKIEHSLKIPEFKKATLAHNLKSLDENLAFLDSLLDEHWFMINDDGSVRGTWAEWWAS